SLGANSDEWVSSVVNYVRYEFGNAGRRFRRPGDTTSPFVSIPEVASIRSQNASRVALWTMEELETGIAQTDVVMKTNTDDASKKVVVTSSKKTRTAPNKKSATKSNAKTNTVTKTGFAAVQPLLQKYTCLTCHNPNKKVIGPSYSEIAKRKYSIAKIIQLIQKPNPANWSGFATKMPSMAHVPVSELTQIAKWIKSLEKTK
ncbi:MAG: hypothetical protein JJE22_09330, partial [Bacteroidia bacterium]|nr:hypothetical protein [Bacteroidia bacterium]